ncbi:unnamed protein product [Rotaria magnacalcarata]|uniref:Uncharacterized protein n=2 Tax=Rotaria magnacalcarata TaxID=392030 RepID=A0A8S2L928_9BILA|nr:unnamed protein product [Rotaria magnacalcarata]
MIYFLDKNIPLLKIFQLKSKEIQELVRRLYNDGCGGNEIHKSLRGLISKRTIFYWLKSIKATGTIQLQGPPCCPMLPSKKLNVSRSTVRRIIKDDLGYKAFVKRVAPKLTEKQKIKRKSFGLWVRKNIRKSMTAQILFSDEKRFDLDGMYNRQNERIYAATHDEADEKGAVHRKTKFPTGVMVWLGVCYEGITRPVIIENGTIDTNRYIADILPVALKDGKQMLDNEFIFQQDGATPHTAKETQQWCKILFFDFWSKDRWPPNSPDLNPLDYCVWNELCQHMNWSHVVDKQALINEIKQGAKKIQIEVVRRSVTSWTNRIYKMLENEGNYLF